MAIEFGQILPDGIPGYEGGVVVTPEIVTDTTLTTSPDTPRPRQPVPNNQTTTAESIGTPGSSDQFPSRTDWEQEPDPVTTVPKRYGAHKTVIDGLSRISFVSGCIGGEMSDAIAYIRYWSRSGVSQKNPIQLSQQFTIPDSKSNELGTTLSNLYGSDIDFNSTQYSLPENYRPADAFKGTPVNLFNSQYDFTTPEFNPTVTVSEQTQSGSVYAANPSGSTESSSAPANDAVWQFLFNPEELQLSSGPEYNRAESWGVSDPANSGQPLSWRMNRNRKLTFGKVLLHGYSFGKRVDSLEKGLQDLFMAREGEGSDGPPVLEFVWGKRVFGPCVIQNIQVREKAWDKGILVNAEVSFELEQVPEWTINDGFVDVLRPGRQPTVNDPSIASENYRATPSSPAPTGEDNPQGNKPGGGGGRPASIQDCQKFYSWRKRFNDLEFALKQLKSKPLPVDPRGGPYQGRPLSNIYKILPVMGGTFTITGNKSTSPKELIEAVDRLTKIRKSSECDPETYKQSYEYNIEQAYKSGSNVTSQIKNLDDKHTDIAIKCIRLYKKVTDDGIAKVKCAPSAIPTGGRQGPGLY